MKFNYLLPSLALLFGLSATTASAYVSSYYTTTSHLASGKWVKIKVTESGIQQLDDATLKALGFANPEKVAVYGYGGSLLLTDKFTSTLPDDLPRQYAVHTDGKLLFYGQAGEYLSLSGLSVTVNTSPYSFEGCYFLTDTPRDTVDTTAIPYTERTTKTESHIAAYAVNRERRNYENLGERWFDNFLDGTTPTYYRFPITDALSSNMRLGFTWVSDETASLSVTISPEISAITSNGESISSPTSLTRRTGYRTFLPPTGADTLAVDFTLTAPRAIGDFIAMDYATLSFYRRNTLGSDPQRTMYLSVSSNANVKFVDLPDGAMVWDVTSASDVRPYTISDNTITPSATTATAILFDPSARQFVPEVVDTDLPSQNLHALATPQMLIVTLPELRTQADELAQLHRDEQGLDVLVVNADDIYNEFSSGTFSAQGVRRFVKMLYDRDPSRLRSLLLYGIGSQDMRHITHSLPILPTRECSTEAYMYSVSQSYCSDSYFAMLEDSFNPTTLWYQQPLIAVGRIPVGTPSEALNINAKIRRFITTPAWQRAANTAVYIADNNDGGQYTESIDAIAENIASRTASVTFKDYVDFFPAGYSVPMPQLNSRVRAQIEDGVGFVHYMGHSAYSGFVTGEYGITSSNLHNYSNETLPIFILSTCNLGQFDGVRSTLGSTALAVANGAVACMVYSRESWARGNENSHTIIGNNIAAARNGITLGELWLKIRKECLVYHRQNARYAINDLNRNLLGDPELPLRFPDQIATIHRVLSTGSDSTTVAALTPVKFNGEICDSLGNRLSDFNGTVTLQAFQEGIVTTTRGLRDSSAKGKEIVCGSVSLAKATAEVADGCYEITLTIPQQSDSCALRITAYAESADTRTAAVGELSGLALTTSEDATDDTIAPDITSFYAATEENVVTSADEKLYAEIAADPSGIALGAMPLENALHVAIDGKTVGNAVGHASTQTDGSARVEMPIGSLPDGRHTATISVSDNCGNRTESTITFEVAMATATATLRCLTDVARDYAQLEWEHSYRTTVPEATVIVTDRSGNTVANVKTTDTQWQWDLKDLKGKAVDNGTYTASVLTSDGRRYTASAPVTFTVLR